MTVAAAEAVAVAVTTPVPLTRLLGGHLHEAVFAKGRKRVYANAARTTIHGRLSNKRLAGAGVSPPHAIANGALPSTAVAR